MVRRRRSSRRKPYKVVKYSNETQNFQVTYTPPQQADQQVIYEKACVFVEPLGAQGMRKVKNFTIQLLTTYTKPLIWALVYVPQGTNPSSLDFEKNVVYESPQSLYEPNQNVILSGVTIDGSSQQTWRTRLARNLNSGDGIALVLSTQVKVTEAFGISCTVNYSIIY